MVAILAVKESGSLQSNNALQPTLPLALRVRDALLAVSRLSYAVGPLGEGRTCFRTQVTGTDQDIGSRTDVFLVEIFL